MLSTSVYDMPKAGTNRRTCTIHGGAAQSNNRSRNLPRKRKGFSKSPTKIEQISPSTSTGKNERKKSETDKNTPRASIKTNRTEPLATSPRKTRGVGKKDEDLECETCGQCEPLQFLYNCPNCTCVFHLSCLGLEPNTVDFFAAHPDKWRCPRCVECAKCALYIYDANNVQCTQCGRAFHGWCRSKKSAEPVYPYFQWSCDKCEANTRKTFSPLSSPRPVVSVGTPIKKEKVAKRRASPPKRSSSSTGKSSARPIKLLKVEENLLEHAGVNRETRANLYEDLVSMVKQEMNLMDTPLTTGKKRVGRRPNKKRSSATTQQHQAALSTKIADSTDEEDKISVEDSDFALASKMAVQKMNVMNEWVYFGQTIRFKLIYESSYPLSICLAPNVYVCEFCFRAMADVCQFKNHLMFCRWRHPPGNEIYRDGILSIWEVEGCLEPIYCRNLCLLAKFFLSSKTLYHEVETFTFYILTEITDRGFVLAGYFSKEKNPSKNNNLSCLLTLPSHQSKGYGKLLIDLSYHLSMREHKIGSPEHPLSDMGLIAYRSYWRSIIICALRKRRNQHTVSIKDLSIETAVHSYDIISTLLALGRLTFRNDNFYIDTNLAFNASLSSFRRRTIDANRLIWEPEFEVTPGNKMNSYVVN